MRDNIIKRDCYWYHCEHDMGASIDYCTLCDNLWECPCSEDCKNYISNKKVTRQLKYRVPTKVTHEATVYKCCTCPSCGNVVDQLDEFFGKKFLIMNDYCPYCGAKMEVKWG